MSDADVAAGAGAGALRDNPINAASIQLVGQGWLPPHASVALHVAGLLFEEDEDEDDDDDDAPVLAPPSEDDDPFFPLPSLEASSSPPKRFASPPQPLPFPNRDASLKMASAFLLHTKGGHEMGTFFCASCGRTTRVT